MDTEGINEIGHLIAGDVSNKLEFKIFSNSNISVGDFVLLKDKHLEEKNDFVGRITNIKLQTLGRSDYLTEMSTQIEVSPIEVDPYEFRDSRSEILARVAEASLIGILKDGKILSPKKIPNHLSPVLIPKVMKWNGLQPVEMLKLAIFELKCVVMELYPLNLTLKLLVKNIYL